jgi:hypothetical protein
VWICEENILKSPPLQLFPDNGFHALLLVEGVPELGNNEEVLALHQALVNGSLDTLARLLLVPVI